MARAHRGALAIDHGTVRSGFAVTDPLGLSVQPLPAHEAPGDGEELLDHVAALLDERDVSHVVVGLPRRADGSEGERARDVRSFAERLARRFPRIEVAFVDETLTTVEADARLREAGYRGREAKRRRDSMAALLLLEEWLGGGPAPAPDGPAGAD